SYPCLWRARDFFRSVRSSSVAAQEQPRCLRQPTRQGRRAIRPPTAIARGARIKRSNALIEGLKRQRRLKKLCPISGPTTEVEKEEETAWTHTANFLRDFSSTNRT